MKIILLLPGYKGIWKKMYIFLINKIEGETSEWLHSWDYLRKEFWFDKIIAICIGQCVCFSSLEIGFDVIYLEGSVY